MLRRWEPGNPGGNVGRPPGRRNSYLHTKAFRVALKEAWDLYGKSALKIFAREDPGGFCKLYAYLEPKDIHIESIVTEISDAELASMIENLRAQIAQQQQVPMLIEAQVVNEQS
jgi:hypothetical protein